LASFGKQGNEAVDSTKAGKQLISLCKLICRTEVGLVLYLANVIWMPNSGFKIFSLLYPARCSRYHSVRVCHLSLNLWPRPQSAE